MRFLAFLLVYFSALSGAWAQTHQFLPVDEALRLSHYSEPGELVVDWLIEPGHYMYQEATQITLDEGQEATLGTPKMPNHVVEKYDEFFDETLLVYYDYLTLRLPVESSGPVTFSVRYQGCAEAGLCYPPQTRTVTFDPSGTVNPLPERPQTSAAALPTDLTGSGLATWLSEGSVVLAIGLFFLLGLGLTFTPCVLPMLPIMSALVMGEQRPSTPRAAVIAVTYVIAMALTYALAGLLVASLGAAGNVQAAMQTPWVVTLFAALFALLALAMFGLFNMQLPAGIATAIQGVQNRIQRGHLASVAAVGSLSALVVSPCVSAPLAGALIYISATGDMALGFFALLALGLGMGVPLILVAVGGAKFLPRTGPWMNQVKNFFGVLLLGVSVWLLSRWISPVLTLALWGFLALGYAISLGVFAALRAPVHPVRQFLGVVILVYGVAALWGALGGATDPLRPVARTLMAGGTEAVQEQQNPFYRVQDVAELRTQLRDAANSNQPVMLDFYADWCVSCKVMKRTIFTQEDVQGLLSGYRWVQIDVTDNTRDQQALLDEYGLFGPPAVLFFTPSGQWLNALTIQGEVTKPQFLRHIEAL
ncbi:protein-disulfide reductase DsbD [Salinispirillum marinum]|uniref:Protein-disulfide reductase DsbD n=2 Tax=Saccharospirillaceae TaxID=255527 RepID=A0ABV8BFA7_9GAMM